MKLTTRQWQFYNYLKEQAVDNEKKWVDKAELGMMIPLYNLNYDDLSHDICSTMNLDRLTINNSSEVDKLILIKDNRFKIATYEEAREMEQELYNQAMKLLARMGVIGRKINKDGQGKLLSNQIRPIDSESQARPYVETFIRGN